MPGTTVDRVMTRPEFADVLNPGRPWGRRPWPWLLLILAAVGCGALLLRGDDAPPPRFATVTADRGDIISRVTASGTLSALVTVDVGSQVSGRIQALYADFNTQVREGERIAKIDPTLFEAQVASARANVQAAEAGVQRARVQLADAGRQAQRADELLTRKLIAQSERDTVTANAEAAQADVAAAEGQLAQARAAHSQAEANLRYTDIVSPTDGIVISRSVNVGQTVAASLQAPVLFQIAQDLRQMQVNTSVAEADVGRLRPDMPVYFGVDAWPEERFVGRVRQIRNSPQILQNVVTYDAVIDVDNADLRLKPGMTANATFIVAQRENVLRIPNAALRFRPPQSLLSRATEPPTRRVAADSASGDAAARTVWVLRSGVPQALTLRLGISDGSHTEVIDGALQADDRLITGTGGGEDAASKRNDRFRML
jgi:HlyD family secretion protein